MATLAKGLAVLGSFDKQRPAMTLSQAAQATGVSRATVRRILRTLTELGYVVQEGRQFSLSSGILKLGFAYLATQNWIEQAAPLMRQLGESSANPARRQFSRERRLSTSRAYRPAASCRWRLRSERDCQPFIRRWGESNSALLTTQSFGGVCDRCVSRLTRRRRSLRYRRSSIACRTTTPRDFPLLTKSSSAGCGRSQYRSWNATAKRSPRSTSVHIRRAPRETRCGSAFSLTCARSRSRSRPRSFRFPSIGILPASHRAGYRQPKVGYRTQVR